jgi:hypothetical protein
VVPTVAARAVRDREPVLWLVGTAIVVSEICVIFQLLTRAIRW